MHATSLVLTFDRALDSVSATRLDNYRITDSAGHRVRVKSVSYDSVANTVTIHPVGRLNIHHGYQFRVIGTGSDGVKGSDGSLIDGKSAGQADSDYTAVIDWRSLVLTGPARSLASHPRGPLAGRGHA